MAVTKEGVMVRLLLSVFSFFAGAVLASSWWAAAMFGGPFFIIPMILTLLFAITSVAVSCNYLAENWNNE